MPAADRAAEPFGFPAVASKEVFVFDWDGTLFDSMAGKTTAFAHTASSYLGERYGVVFSKDDAARIYRTHSGLRRAEIFEIMADGLGVRLDEQDLRAMNDRLFALNRRGLATAPMFADGLRLLNRLFTRDAEVFLSSSVPQDELDYFTEMKLNPIMRAKLKGSYGSRADFAKGPGHIAEILRRTGRSPGAVLVIGDDVTDDRLSAAAGVDCIVVDRENRAAGRVRATVSSLDEIAEWLS